MKDATSPTLLGLFSPTAPRKIEEAKKNLRFVHYTSAETAKHILCGKHIWMRNANTMNDSRENEHGLECLRNALGREPGERLRKILEQHFPGLYARLKPDFDDWTPRFKAGTFLACVSEHCDSEDSIGRLSMWRAYGGRSGVALVIKNTPFLSEIDAFHTYLMPVQYLGEKEFENVFDGLVDGFAEEIGFLREQGDDEVYHRLFTMMRLAVVATKHPGFAEEKEWRIIYTPEFSTSRYVTRSIEVVGGIPQIVYKLPLNKISERGPDTSIPEILDRLIIGPTNFSREVRDAFVALLQDLGVQDAGNKVIVSDIPLR